MDGDKRLFVAINLPPHVRRDIWEAAAPLREGKAPIGWVRADCIHLTLKFLGAVAPEREPAIHSAVDAAVAGTKPFVLAIGGYGVFPSPSRPKVIWIGCERLPALEILQHEIERAMESVGFALEMRAFHPHLTLGRVKRGARASEVKHVAVAMETGGFTGETLVESVEVMESTLTRSGPRYTERHRAVLEA